MELERLTRRAKPNAVEAVAIERAARAIAAYSLHKADSAERWQGETAWSIIDSVTTEARRFHALISIACLQQQVRDFDDMGVVRINDRVVDPGTVRKVKAFAAQGLPTKQIGVRLGLAQRTVVSILDVVQPL